MGNATSSPPVPIAVTSVKIEQAKLDAFKQIAASHRRTVSQELRWLIDQAIAADEREAA